jgi:two-component system OmpR family response regulator
MLVGACLRPDAALTAMLARDGMRGIWLGGLEEAMRATRLAVFDVAAVDASVADPSGARGLIQLRTLLHCPMLMVAGQADEIDEIVALEMGADAYLVQPVAPRRLRAHLRALMRRQPGAPGSAASSRAPARFDDWVLDRASGVLSGHGRRIELTDVQSRLMQVLMDAAGLAVPRTALMAALPRSSALAARSVDVYVSRLRLRLEQEGVQHLRVQMVRSCGYALQGLHTAAPAQQATAPAPLSRHLAQPEPA